MKKVTIFLFALLILSLVSCNSGQDPATPLPDSETETESADSETTDSTQSENEGETADTQNGDAIILQMAVYDWERGNYRDLVDTFEAENPDIEIKMVSVEETLGLESGGIGEWPEDGARRLVGAADVITTNAIGGARAQKELLLDLRPLMDADAGFSEDDFYPNALEFFSSDGGIFGLPSYINFTLLFYQKDMFDEAGVPYPEVGWTWDDFLAAARATTQSEGDDVGQWGFVQPGISPTEFVLPRVGPLVDTSTEPPTPQIDRPDVAEAVTWFADLYITHEVAPILDQPEPDEDGSYVPAGYDLINNGQAAIWPEWSGAWEWRGSDMDLGVVPFPVEAPDDQTTQMFVNGYVLSAGTRHPEAAWRWLDFLSRQEVGGGFGGDTSIPARRSIAESSGFWDNVDPELGEALHYALDHSFFLDYTPGYGAFYDAVRDIINEKIPVEDALADAQVAAETEIAEADIEQDEEGDGDSEEVVVSAPEVEEVPEDAITITFVAGSGPGGLQPYRDLAQTFREEHPDIVIELETPDFGSGIITLHDIAATTDCLQWFGGITSAEDQAALLSMEPFLDADPNLSKDDFYPQILAAVTKQGQLWGLPAEMNVPVIRYTKALFDEAGVPYPEAGWTVEDFLTAAVALTSSDDLETKQYGIVPQEFEINDVTNFLERLNAKILDESEDPPKLSLTHPDTVEAMRWITNLTTEFGVKPTFMTKMGGSFSGSEERKTLIENGRAAMWSDQGFQSFPEISLDGLDVGVAPLPAGSDGTVTASSFITTYFISANTEQRQACWDWITFLSEQSLTLGYGNMVPARRTVAESEAYAQQIGAEFAAANLASVEDITGPSASLSLSSKASWLNLGYSWWLSYAYDQILKEEVPVEEALAEVQEKADAYRTCIIERDGLEDQNIQRICLGEADDEVPSFFIEVDEE